MSLWEHEMKSQIGHLSRMSPLDRLRLSLQAIEWTLQSFEPPFDERFPGLPVKVVSEGLQSIRQALREGSPLTVTPANFEDEAGQVLDEEDIPLGMGNLVMAIANCFGFPPSGMEADHASTLLFDCYQAVVNREEIPVITDDAERSNSNCVHAIEVQKDLIRSFANGA
jgi:hypothetical protein